MQNLKLLHPVHESEKMLAALASDLNKLFQLKHEVKKESLKLALFRMVNFS